MATDKTIGNLDLKSNIEGEEEIAVEIGGQNFKITTEQIKAFIKALTQGENTLTEDTDIDLNSKILSFSSDVFPITLKTSFSKDFIGFVFTNAFGGSSSFVMADGLIFQSTQGTNIGEIIVNFDEVRLCRVVDGDVIDLDFTVDGIVFKNEKGKGVRFNDHAEDEANVGEWGTTPNQKSSDFRLIENLEPIATPQVAVASTPQAITTAFKSTTQNVFGVGALCVFNVTTGCLNVGQKFGVNIGDSDGMDFVAGAGTNVIGVITGSTTPFDTVMIERLPNGSFGLTGEVYKVI